LRHAKTNICPTFDKKRQFATKSGPPPILSNPAGQDAPPRPPGTAAPPGLNPGRFPARGRHSPAGGCYQPGRPPRKPPPGLYRATGKRGRRPPGLPQLFASFREITTFAIAKPPGHPQPPGQNPPKKPQNSIKRKQTRKQCRICGPFPPQPGNPYLIDNRRNTPIASAFLNIIPSELCNSRRDRHLSASEEEVCVGQKPAETLCRAADYTIRIMLRTLRRCGAKVLPSNSRVRRRQERVWRQWPVRHRPFASPAPDRGIGAPYPPIPLLRCKYASAASILD